MRHRRSKKQSGQRGSKEASSGHVLSVRRTFRHPPSSTCTRRNVVLYHRENDIDSRPSPSLDEVIKVECSCTLYDPQPSPTSSLGYLGRATRRAPFRCLRSVPPPLSDTTMRSHRGNSRKFTNPVTFDSSVCIGLLCRHSLRSVILDMCCN